MKKYLVEFISTFFLVFTLGLTVLPPGAGDLAPFAFAAILLALTGAGGHISGAHFNPALTLAAWVRGRCPAADVIPYIGAQLAAATLAALAVPALKTGLVARAAALAGPLTPELLPTLVTEFLFTFALAWVYLHVATARGTGGNSYYGAAIAGTVLAGTLAVGGIAGAAFNPAVALGLCLMGLVAWGSLWIYLAACLAGGVAAAYAFRAVNGRD